MHTASKYDDCRTLHFPHATCNIQFDWICQGNPHDHHSLMPCLPYRVPPSSNNYDTYADFRSKSLDWSINVIVKNRNNKVRTIVINHRVNSSPNVKICVQWSQRVCFSHRKGSSRRKRGRHRSSLRSSLMYRKMSEPAACCMLVHFAGSKTTTK